MKVTLVLAAASALSLLGQSPADQAFTVSGTVVDARNDRPMNRVSVILASITTSSILKPVVTAQDGTFSFQVPAGTYSLIADYKSIRQGLTQGKVSLVGSPVIVGLGHDTSKLVFRWISLSAISGTVTDDRGDPVEGARVQLIGSYVFRGIKYRYNVTYSLTDDRGNYRFSPLSPGTFYVAVSGVPWFSTWFEDSRTSVSRATTAPTPGYSPVYYPSASSFEGAAPIVVDQGDELRADVKLILSPGVTIRVNCPEARDHDATLTLLSDFADGLDLTHRQIKFPYVSATIPGILPGRYRLSISGTANGRFNASATIDVGTTDLTVNVTPQPMTSIDGKIELQGRQPPGQGFVVLLNKALRDGPVIPLRPDGTFRAIGLLAGRYDFSLLDPDLNFAIVDTKVEGAVIRNGNLEIQDGAAVRLTLTISDETSHVKIVAMTGEAVTPGAFAVLVPRETSKDSRLDFGFQTGTDGSYELPGIRPGDYLLFAFDDRDFEYANRAALAPYLAMGVPLHVDAHQTYEKRVQVVVTQEKK